MSNCRPVIVSIVLWTISCSILPAQWSSTYGPEGKNVNCLALVDGDVFAGTYSGVFRSSDNGSTWIFASGGLTNTSVLSLAVIDTVLFAATWGAGVFRSEDRGVNWTAVSSGLADDKVHALAVNGADLFAGTESSGAFRSSDKGATWVSINTGLPAKPVRAFAFIDTTIFVLAWGEGVYRSSDNGANWLPAKAGLTRMTGRVLAVTGRELFAGMVGGIFRSSDNGSTWIAVNTGMTATSMYALIAYGHHLFAGADDGGVFHSDDDGMTWRAVNDGLGNTNVHALAATATSLLAGTFGDGVWRRPLSEIALSVPRKDGANVGVERTVISIYPHPLSTEGRISYSLDARSTVTISLYDALGRCVARPVVDAVQERGDHEVWVSVRHLEPGLYSCRLRSGEIHRYVPMVVVR